MKTPRRILHVFGGMDRGGAETLVMGVYRQIDRSEIQFDFAVNTGRACHFDQEIEGLGGRILRHPIPSEAGLRGYSRAFARTLATSGPFSAVHSHVHHFSGALLRLSKRQGIPVRISHSQTTGDLGRLPLRRQAYERFMQYLIRTSATHLLGCSRQACEALFGTRCWSDSRVQMVPNAVCLADYADSAESRRLLRQELKLAPGTPLLGHVGSFIERKNQAFVVQVFQELIHRVPDAHLVLVGDGATRPKIEKCIREAGLEGSVHVLGIRADVPRIMSGLDLLLLPSLWEGLPVVVVEALAAGVPCLVSDTVTSETDLNTGLVRFLSLQSGRERWAEECLTQLRCARPSAAEREHALSMAGYDVRSVARRLSSIYLS